MTERVENILNKVKELQLPGKKVLAGRQQEFSVVVIDATEMPIERPKKSNSSSTAARKSGPAAGGADGGSKEV